jgi:hypothetical protein
VTILCTGTYWRNAWKYQARTYRHFGWDHGTLLANMLAVSAASGLPVEIVLGFVDAEVNSLLDLDTHREVSWCLVPIGRAVASSPPAPREAPALKLETIALSKREVEYPAMLEMHHASSLQRQVNGVRAAAKALGDSTGKEIKAVKKRVLSAAGRAAIIKAAKKRWSKVKKQAKKVTG